MSLILRRVSTDGVGGDEAVERRPERMLQRQGLKRSGVDVRGNEVAGLERLLDRRLVVDRAATDVIVDRISFHLREAINGEEMRCLATVRKDVHDVINLGEPFVYL